MAEVLHFFGQLYDSYMLLTPSHTYFPLLSSSSLSLCERVKEGVLRDIQLSKLALETEHNT